MEREFTRYEKARILGARALQIAMNAPLLIKMSEKELEEINFDALKIAEKELESDILPISVKRPFPSKKEDKLKKPKDTRMSDKKKEELEVGEEEKIEEEGEIMALSTPEDEVEEIEEE